MPRGGRRPGAGRKPRATTAEASSPPAQSLAEAKRHVRRKQRADAIGPPREKPSLLPDAWAKGLTPKEYLFVQEYLIDLNATAAYLRAGFQSQDPGANAARLIKKDRVAQAIAHAMAARSKRIHVDQDRVLMELARIGFADLRRIFETRAGKAPATGIELYLASRKAGDERAFEALPREAQDAWHSAAAAIPPMSGGFFLKSPEAIDDNTAAAISGIEVVTKSVGDGEVEYVHKIKTTDKKGALELMGRHLGMFHEKGAPTGNTGHVVDDKALDDELLARMETLLAKARGKGQGAAA